MDGDGPATDIAIAITGIIERNRTAGWQHDRDLQSRIRSAIDDFFLDQILSSGAINIGLDVIDMITDGVLASARVRIADDGRTR